MPHIIVTAGNAADDDRASVTLRERINASDFESERFATNLVERLGWAVDDATEAERDDATEAEREEPARPPRTRQRPITGNRRSKARSERGRSPETESQLEPVGSA
jgi:hypothetical protein